MEGSEFLPLRDDHQFGVIDVGTTETHKSVLKLGFSEEEEAKSIVIT